MAIAIVRHLHSVNDDLPYIILRLSTDETLCAEASAQEVDKQEPLPLLNWIRGNAVLEHPPYFRLPGLVHGLILMSLDHRAEVKVYARHPGR